MKLIIDISKGRYDEIMAMDWKNGRLVFSKEVIAIHDGIPLEECGDAISRQAVLDLPRIKTHNQWGNVIKESVDVEDVRQLPPVTPQPKMEQEPKTGHWITCDVLQEVKCSECRVCFRHTTNYCPNCGAKMEED